MSKAERFLQLDHARQAAKFLIVLLMKLVTQAKLPFLVTEYSHQMQQDLGIFLNRYGDAMGRRNASYTDVMKAVRGFTKAAEAFHFTLNPYPSMDMLAHHEFNDQTLDLERAFLLPSFATTRDGSQSLAGRFLDGPYYRQLIYGPSPLNRRETAFLPRLSAALAVATTAPPSEKTDKLNWKVVERELFFVVDSLESAKCILDNHLVSPPQSKHHQHL